MRSSRKFQKYWCEREVAGGADFTDVGCSFSQTVSYATALRCLSCKEESEEDYTQRDTQRDRRRTVLLRLHDRLYQRGMIRYVMKVEATAS